MGNKLPPVSGRQLHPFKPAGIYASSHPEEKSRPKKPGIYWEDPKPTRVRMVATHDWRPSDSVKHWVAQPDPKRERSLGERERHEEHPLTKISRKLPAKLPVLTFSPMRRRKHELP